MRIYRVIPDVNRYQYFVAEDDRVWESDLLTLDASPKLGTWSPPEVFILKPAHKAGAFYGLSSVGGIVVASRATDILRDLLEMSGELLPLFHKGREFFLLNVLECINVLDEDKTEWVYGETTRAKLHINKYAFKPHRLTEAPLFKVPEEAKTEIFTAEGLKAPQDEFKYVVEHNRLEGLIFEEVWNSEEG